MDEIETRAAAMFEAECPIDAARAGGVNVALVRNAAIRAIAAALRTAPAAAGVPKGYVLVLAELANRVQDSLGRFTSDEGWGQSDIDTADDFAAGIAAPEQRAVPDLELPGMWENADFMGGKDYEAEQRADAIEALRRYEQADEEGIDVKVNRQALEWAISALAARQSVGEEPRSMDTAPRDGTMLRLLVQFEDHATEDTEGPAWTIGSNSFDHTGEDLWQFAGWCWTHDHFTEGKGTPVGWLPMHATPPAQAVPEDVRRDVWRPISEAPAETLCIVGWNDPDDGEARHDFDFLDEEGSWVGHDELVEHARMVAPPGSKLPAEEAPYQWFIEVPKFPAAQPQGEEAAAPYPTRQQLVNNEYEDDLPKGEEAGRG